MGASNFLGRQAARLTNVAGHANRLTLLACLVALLVGTDARQVFHSRLGSRFNTSWRHPGDCLAERSPTQREIDKAYNLQRRKLDQAIARLPQHELANWDALQGWRIWELYPPIYNCPTKEKLGNQPSDGGKFICGVDTLLQHPDCVVFSFGSNGEPSFEIDILHKTPCIVHTFDPTLDAVKRQALQTVPDIQVHEIGIGASNSQEHISGFNATVQTLQATMEQLDVQWIDLLKIDIEGGEWKVLTAMLDHFGEHLPFTQLQIEFHFERRYGTSGPEVLNILQRLEAGGMRVFSFEYNFLAGGNVPGYLEYSFINAKDCRILV